jgi:hypothetical protein
MSADDPLTLAIADANGDPMIAALELVPIYLRNARRIDDDPERRHRASRIFAASSNCWTAARNHSPSKQPRISSNCVSMTLHEAKFKFVG